MVSHGTSSVDGQSRESHNLGMLLKVAEDLLPIGVGDLGVDFGVLDIRVAEVVGDVLNAAAGLEKMHGDRVTKRMDGPAGDACLLGVCMKKSLHHALLERPLAAGEKVGAGLFAYTEVRSQGLCGMPSQRPLATDTILEAADADAVLFQVNVVNGDRRGFIHAEAIVIDQADQGPVAGRDV